MEHFTLGWLNSTPKTRNTRLKKQTCNTSPAKQTRHVLSPVPDQERQNEAFIINDTAAAKKRITCIFFFFHLSVSYHESFQHSSHQDEELRPKENKPFTCVTYIFRQKRVPGTLVHRSSLATTTPGPKLCEPGRGLRGQVGTRQHARMPSLLRPTEYQV